MAEVEVGSRPRRKISNEEFNLAYFGDSKDASSLRAATDNRNVIAAVLHKYKKQLSKDDLHSIGLTAMWKALQYHLEKFGQKFTTSLHRFADWECKRELRRQGRWRGCEGRPRNVSIDSVPETAVRHLNGVLEHTLETREQDLQHLWECVELLPYEWQKTVLRQHYQEGMTLGEVGRANGYSKEAARQRIIRSVEALRELAVFMESSAGVLEK